MMKNKIIDCLKSTSESIEKLNDTLADITDCLDGVSLYLGDVNENLDRVENRLFMLEHELRQERKANEK